MRLHPAALNPHSCANLKDKVGYIDARVNIIIFTAWILFLLPQMHSLLWLQWRLMQVIQLV